MVLLHAWHRSFRTSTTLSLASNRSFFLPTLSSLAPYIRGASPRVASGDRFSVSPLDVLHRLKEQERERLQRLEEERLAAEQEAARQACLEIERRREAKERERMQKHDEDIGERPRKMRRSALVCVWGGAGSYDVAKTRAAEEVA